MYFSYKVSFLFILHLSNISKKTMINYLIIVQISKIVKHSIGKN